MTKPCVARGFDGLVEETPHAPVAREVGVDRRLRLGRCDAQLVRDAEGRRSVDDPEVDRLGARALVGADRFGRDAEDLGRGAAVDVLAVAERGEQVLVAREVREDAQLHLRVVGGEQDARLRARRTPRGSARPPRCGSGCSARSDSTPRGDRSPRPVWWKVGWMRPRLGIDERRQRVDVGALQLREAPELEDARRQRVLRGELLEHRLVGREAGLGLAHRGQLQLLEEDGPAAAWARRSGRRPPASSWISASMRASARSYSRESARSAASSTRTPARSMRASTADERHLDFVEERRRCRRGSSRSRSSGARSATVAATSPAHAAVGLDRQDPSAGTAFAPRPASSSQVRRPRPRCCAASAATPRVAAGSSRKRRDLDVPGGRDGLATALAEEGERASWCRRRPNARASSGATASTATSRVKLRMRRESRVTERQIGRAPGLEPERKTHRRVAQRVLAATRSASTTTVCCASDLLDEPGQRGRVAHDVRHDGRGRGDGWARRLRPAPASLELREQAGELEPSEELAQAIAVRRLHARDRRSRPATRRRPAAPRGASRAVPRRPARAALRALAPR